MPHTGTSPDADARSFQLFQSYQLAPEALTVSTRHISVSALILPGANMRMLVLSILLLAASSLPAPASVIAVFDNPTYVDTSGGPPVPSSDALQALLTSQGNTVHTFTGLTAADFTTALSGANLILFPSLLNF